MKNQQILNAAVFTAMLSVGSGTVALAGEITGTGKAIEVHGKSACAFSGLEDNAKHFSPGAVQNFGKHPNDTFGTGGVSDSSENIPSGPGPAAPGVGCNPSPVSPHEPS